MDQNSEDIKKDIKFQMGDILKGNIKEDYIYIKVGNNYLNLKKNEAYKLLEFKNSQ